MRRVIMFRDRVEAAHLLARRFKGRVLSDSLVLAIPRGGVVTGAVLARELGAELDVVLSRKLRAPDQPELAIGAVAEDGQVYLDPAAKGVLDLDDEYVESERAHQFDEVKRRKALFRAVRPQALIEGRSVIVTDDGIATGATMMAALQVARTKNAFELIVAVPVASPDQLQEIRRYCDEVICILAPRSFWAIGQFYQDFSPVGVAEALELLRAATPVQRPA
jgi:predicted phosphoribosyltransferase